MIIWTGWGILVPVQFIALTVLAETVVSTIWGPGYYSSQDEPSRITSIVASISLYPVGVWLNKGRTSAGESVMLQAGPRESARHTFFFIPYQHCMWAGLGLMILLESAS